MDKLEMGHRNLGYFDISPELIVELLTLSASYRVRNGSLERVDLHGLPKDARGLRCGITDNGDVRVVFESEENPCRPEGCPISSVKPELSLSVGDEALQKLREELSDADLSKA